MKTVIVEESPFPMRTINSMGAYATSRNGLTNSGKTDKPKNQTTMFTTKSTESKSETLFSINCFAPAMDGSKFTTSFTKIENRQLFEDGNPYKTDDGNDIINPYLITGCGKMKLAALVSPVRVLDSEGKVGFIRPSGEFNKTVFDFYLKAMAKKQFKTIQELADLLTTNNTYFGFNVVVSVKMVKCCSSDKSRLPWDGVVLDIDFVSDEDKAKCEKQIAETLATL